MFFNLLIGSWAFCFGFGLGVFFVARAESQLPAPVAMMTQLIQIQRFQ